MLSRRPEHDNITRPKKIIAFDLDETLGYFSEFGIFHSAIEQFTGTQLTPKQSFRIFDLYAEELMRPKIMAILRMVMGMKRSGIIDNIMIYTNNQGGERWTYMIKEYFEFKVGVGKIFDKTICAYKKYGRKNVDCEHCRTTHSKTYNDLVVNCCNFSKSTKVCFVDDQHHPYMKNHPNVYYIRVTPYVHSITPQVFIERFLGTRLLSSQIREQNRGSEFTTYVLRNFNRTGHYSHVFKTKESLENDISVSKKLVELIRKFESF